jgi:hypothetical protein
MPTREMPVSAWLARVVLTGLLTGGAPLWGCSPSLTQGSEPTAGLGPGRGPPLRLPEPRILASSEDGIVGLELSRRRSEATGLVRRFFDAVRRESLRDLARLMSDDATVSSGFGVASQAAIKVWETRFQRLDYGHRPGRGPLAGGGIGLFTAHELERLGELRHFELEPGGEELLAVIEPRGEDRLDGPRRFGRRLELVIGPSRTGLTIRRLFEDFRLP